MKSLIKFILAFFLVGILVIIRFWYIAAIIVVLMLLRRIFFGSRMERRIHKEVKYEEKARSKYHGKF